MAEKNFLKSVLGLTDTMWTSYFMRGAKTLMKRLVGQLQEKSPLLFKQLWWIYNRSSTEERTLFDAAFRAMIVPFDRLTKILPIPPEVKDLIEDMLGDVINDIQESLDPKVEPGLPDGVVWVEPSGQVMFEEIATAIVGLFPNWMKRFHSRIVVISDHVTVNVLLGRKFDHHDFKQMRSAELGLSPDYIAKWNATWQRIREDRYKRWQLLESSEYLTTTAGWRVFLDRTDVEQDAWLEQNDHDKWFNLPPQVMDFLKSLGPLVQRSAGEMTLALHEYNLEAQGRRNAKFAEFINDRNLAKDPDRWRHVPQNDPRWVSRRRILRIQRIGWTVGASVLVIILAIVFAFATKQYLMGGLITVGLLLSTFVAAKQRTFIWRLINA